MNNTSRIGNNGKNIIAGNTKTTQVYSNQELRTIKEKAEKGLKADAIVISKSDIDRMKQSTKI